MCQIVALDPTLLLGRIRDSGYDLACNTLSTSHTRATFTKDVRSSKVPCRDSSVLHRGVHSLLYPYLAACDCKARQRYQLKVLKTEMAAANDV